MPSRHDGSLGEPTTRRKVLGATAWVAPVIAVALAAPAQAASRPCSAVNNPSNWTTPVQNPTLRPGAEPRWNNQFGGTELSLAQRNSESFLSIQDYVVANTAGTPPQATVTTSTTFKPVAGSTYTLTFRARAGAAQSQLQTLSINMGQNPASLTRVFYGSTRTLTGATVLASPETQYSFTWTAPNSNVATIQYVFTLGRRTAGSHDDIRVTLPVVTATVCT